MKRPEAKRVRRSAADRPFRFSQSAAAVGPRVPTYHGVEKKKIFLKKQFSPLTLATVTANSFFAHNTIRKKIRPEVNCAPGISFSRPLPLPPHRQQPFRKRSAYTRLMLFFPFKPNLLSRIGHAVRVLHAEPCV